MTAETPRALARMLANPFVPGDNIRPLLDMVIQVSGLDCAYLTQVDGERKKQWVLVSQCGDRDGAVIAEGSSAAWDDSLCKRALEQGVSYTTEAESLGRSEAVAAVSGASIRTYMGHPIRDADGTLLGTLCAISHDRVPARENTLATLALFARLLELQVVHDRAVNVARQTFEDEAAGAIGHALAGVADPAALERQLDGVLRLHPWDLVRPGPAGA